MPKQPSLREMLEVIDKAADGDCPLDELDEEEDWLPENDLHRCPACIGRSAWNEVAEIVRINYNDIMELKREQNDG